MANVVTPLPFHLLDIIENILWCVFQAPTSWRVFSFLYSFIFHFEHLPTCTSCYPLFSLALLLLVYPVSKVNVPIRSGSFFLFNPRSDGYSREHTVPVCPWHPWQKQREGFPDSNFLAMGLSFSSFFRESIQFNSSLSLSLSSFAYTRFLFPTQHYVWRVSTLGTK